VIQAVSSAVGPDFPIQVRLGASDYTEGGTTIEDSKIAARAFEKAGLDIIHISGGFVGYTPPGLTGQGYFAPLSEAIKSVGTTCGTLVLRMLSLFSLSGCNTIWAYEFTSQT